MRARVARLGLEERKLPPAAEDRRDNPAPCGETPPEPAVSSALPASVVIIDPAFVGDVVFSGPLVRSLRAARPDVRIGIVVRPAGDQVAQRMVGVDAVHVFDKRGGQRGWRGLSEASENLEKEHYDLALIPHPSLRSALLARRAKIPVRIGSAPPPAAWLLTKRVEPPANAGFVERRLALLAPLLPALAPDPSLTGTLSSKGARRDDSGRRRVGLVLGSHWATKRWPVERAVELVERIDPRSFRLVWLGSESERPLFRPLAGRGAARDAIDAAGGTIDQLIDAIAACDVVLAGDTGPLHIARALGVPVIGLFGPTSAGEHRFSPSDRVLAVDVPCRPCSAHGPARCPLQHHRCMRDLGADRVLRAISEVVVR